MSERERAALRAWRHTGGTLRIIVSGASMAPLLRPGDLIEVEALAPEALRPGTILVVQDSGGLLTHRLARAQAGTLILWGDALPTHDPPLPVGALLGHVVARERSGHRLALRGWPWEQIGRGMVTPPWRRIARRALTVALRHTAAPAIQA